MQANKKIDYFVIQILIIKKFALFKIDSNKNRIFSFLNFLFLFKFDFRLVFAFVSLNASRAIRQIGEFAHRQKVIFF